MIRTIDSAGVELTENDVSLRTKTPVGTNVLVHGFASQGPTNELVTVSTKEELDELFFGNKGPTNPAETYFYSSCKEILNSPSTLMVTRLPYGSGGGYDDGDSEYSALAYPLTAWKLETGQFALTADQDICPFFDPNCFTYTLSSNLSALTAEPNLKGGDFSTMAYYPSGDFLLGIGMDPDPAGGKLRLTTYTTDFMHLTTLTGNGFFDAEGLCWVSGSTFALIEERTGNGAEAYVSNANLHYFDYEALPATFFSGVDTTIFNVGVNYFENDGPEGLAYDEDNDRFIFTREGNEDNLSDAFDPDNSRSIGVFYVPTTGGSASALFPAVEKLSAHFPNAATRGADLTECFYDQGNKNLWIMSDRASALFVTDLSGNVLATMDVPLFQAEAMTMDLERGDLYVGGEPAQIMKYSYGNGDYSLVQDLSGDVSEIYKIIPDSVTMTITHYLSTPYGFTILSAFDLVDDNVGNLSANSDAVSGWVNYGTAQFHLSSYLQNVWNPLSTVVDASFSYLASSTNLGDLTYIETDDPYYIPLTETEYETVQTGQITWQLNGGVPDTYDNIGNAGFVVVNKGQMNIDEENQGYYLSVTDNSKLEDGNYNSVEVVRSINSTPTLVDLDESVLGFPLSGTAATRDDRPSISETIEESYNYDFMDSFYNNSIMMNLFKIDKSPFDRDTDKLYYNPIESYTGGLQYFDKRVNPITRDDESFFLDDKLSDQSNYLEMFTNSILSQQLQIDYLRSINTNVHPVGPYYSRKNGGNSLKHIGNLPEKIAKALTLAENINASTVDITIGAGLETIWAYVADLNGVTSFDDTKNISTELAALTDVGSGGSSPFAAYHKTIFDLYNNFSANTRRDCVHYSDPLRCVFIQGEKFKTLDRGDKNFTSNILTPMKHLYRAANSNYSATYANWVSNYDANTGNYVWLPFSGWQAAITGRMDRQQFYWSAPFGLNNGKVQNVTDVALYTNQKQQDALYRLGINPVANFARDGFVTWGQKTLQTKPSAFDRLNVRRLFLILERATYNVARYYVGEPNTVTTRVNVVGVLTPLFELAKNNEGLYDYLIICDESNNTPTVIDNNELRVDIYIKPVRTAEFVLITFHVTRTDQDFNELIN